MQIPRRNKPIADLTNQTFGRFTVLEFAGSKNGNAHWMSRCVCGTLRVVAGCHLKSGHTTSCGCREREILLKRNHKHGRSGTREHYTWVTMRWRCWNLNDPLYGGRGITVCERWVNSFANFYADIGPIPRGKSLDRIDPNGNYCPENVRLATNTEQARNKRHNRRLTHNGETRCLSEWAELADMKPQTLGLRLKHGWSMAEALAIRPIRGSNQKLRCHTSI